MDGLNIGDAVRKLVGQMERDNPDLSESARVKAAWNRVAGADVSCHVTAVFVVPDTQASEVIVYVDSPIWAADLNMSSELYRMKLNIALGTVRDAPARAHDPEQVRKLKFVASKEKYLKRSQRVDLPSDLDAEQRALKQVEPLALSDEENAALERAAAAVEDTQLRSALLDAARANLEWQKGLDAAGKAPEA